jgi:hypothetical protein
MPTSRDYIPMNWAAFAVWFANFIVQLQVLAAKYSVSAAKVAQLVKDNDWVQYWVEAKAAGKQQEKQLNDFVAGVTNGNLGAPALSDPLWSLPAGAPEGVPTGIKARIREAANGIKSQKSIYTIADGTLLGIVTPEEAGKSEQDYIPALKLVSLTNYGLEGNFRLYGLDALRVECRHKGGGWQIVATLTSSPGVFNIVPKTAGEAEEIEIRAIFIKNNVPYGQYSPIYAEIIRP